MIIGCFPYSSSFLVEYLLVCLPVNSLRLRLPPPPFENSIPVCLQMTPPLIWTPFYAPLSHIRTTRNPFRKFHFASLFLLEANNNTACIGGCSEKARLVSQFPFLLFHFLHRDLIELAGKDTMGPGMRGGRRR